MKKINICIVCFILLILNISPLLSYAQSSETTATYDYMIHHLKTGEVTYHSFDDLPPTNDSGVSAGYFPNSIDTGDEDNTSTFSIIGSDDRVPISNTTSAPYSATVHIYAKWDGGIEKKGTGFMVGPNTVVTAAHCVYDDNNGSALGLADKITVTPGLNGDEEPFGSTLAYDVVISHFEASESPADDWAILKLDDALGTDTGWFGVSYQPPSTTYVNTFVYNTGYPLLSGCAGQNSDESLMFCSTGYIRKVDIDYDYLLWGDWDATGGNSGGPVYAYYPNNGYTVMAILTSGSGEDTFGGAYPTSWTGALKISEDMYNTILRHR